MASAASVLPLLVAIAIGGSLLAALVGAWADRFVRTARWLGFACLGTAGLAGVAAGVTVLTGAAALAWSCRSVCPGCGCICASIHWRVLSRPDRAW